jgi:hypothetical protein
MPKPLKKRAVRKPRTDPNEAAFDLVRRSTEGHDDPPAAIQPAQLSAYMAALGHKGGKVSGARRMDMPEEKRREIASKAARKRWDNVAKRKAARKR